MVSLLSYPERHCVRSAASAGTDQVSAAGCAHVAGQGVPQLLGVPGVQVGLAIAPVIAYYASADPRALWQAGGATALFTAGTGAIGYATRCDLTAVARASFWALVALILFDIVLVFVHIPGGTLACSVIGLVIFAGFTMFDFQRLRVSRDLGSASLLAASIFLDILSVFLFFLQIFSSQEED